jgi:hypothetical protein
METNTITSTDSGEFDLYEPIATAEPTSANEGSERTASNESASTDETELTKQPVKKDGLENNNNKANNATTSKAEVVNPNKETEKPKFVSRGEKREQAIKEALAEQKKVLEEIRREKASQAQPQSNQSQTQQNQTQSEPVFIEKPQPPSYTKEQLTAMAQRAQAEGNQEGIQAIRDELAKWDKYDIDLKFWKLENGKKIESFQQAWSDNWKKAVTKFPELSNKESPIYKEAETLARQFPEVLNRQKGDGQYLIAQLAGMRLERKSHASEVAALKEQVTKLTEQLNASQKKLNPASQTSKPNLSSSKESGTPEDKLRKALGISS